jgi:hypothetical protein
MDEAALQAELMKGFNNHNSQQINKVHQQVLTHADPTGAGGGK